MTDARSARPPLFPMFVDLEGAEVLVVGAGGVGERRAVALVDAGARVTVVAPKMGEALGVLARSGRIAVRQRAFRAHDVVGMRLVFSATGDGDVDAAVSRAARDAGALVNVADEIGLSDFHLPAVERRGDIQIAVGTGGCAPGLAARLRDRIAAGLEPGWSGFCRLLGEMRQLAKARIPDSRLRMELMCKAAYDDSLREAVMAGHAPGAEEALEHFVREAEHGAPSARCHSGRGAFVSIVGAGPGSRGLITVAGLERLRIADVVVYDDLVGADLLAEAPAHAELIRCGKRGWRPDVLRPGPDLLVRKAREGGGNHVVRLKGGDPSVFGRLAEELAELERCGVAHEIVPGVTAASAAAAAAGTSLTRRGVSGHVTLVTAVGEGSVSRDPDRVTATLLRQGGTVAVYMGLRSLPAFVAALEEDDIEPGLPSLVVSCASTADERVIRGSLATIVDLVAREEAKSPALVLFGRALGVGADERWLRAETCIYV